MYLSSVQYYLQRYSKNKEASLAPIRDPPSDLTFSSFAPTKTRPDPCPAPSGDPAPPPPVVFPGLPAVRETQAVGWSRPPEAQPGPPSGSPHTQKTPSHLRVAAAVAAAPASERTLQNGDGRSSLGATGPFLARQLTHARVRAASFPSPSREPGDQSRGGIQMAAPGWAPSRPDTGAGPAGDDAAERRSARPQPRLANQHPGSGGSALKRQKGSGRNHYLGVIRSPGSR